MHSFDSLVAYPSSSLPAEEAIKLIDGDRRTSIEISSGDSFRFSLGDNGLFLVNMYTIMLENSQNKPTSWRVEGSNDGSTWVIIDARESGNYFLNKKSERFVLNSQLNYFQSYRIVFDSFQSTAPISVAEIQLQQVFQVVHNPHLGYSSRVFSFYPGETGILVSPLYSGFSSFTIEPTDLPSGLVFSTLSGQFSGLIASSHPYFNSVFLITATHQSGQEMITQVVIQVMSCTNSYSLLQVELVSKGESSRIEWDLKWNNEFVLGGRGNDEESTETVQKCLVDGYYELTLHNRMKDEWPAGSYLTVSLIPMQDAQSLLLGNCFIPNDQESLSIPLSLAFYSTGLITDWTYAYQSAVPENWYSASSSVQWVFAVSGLELARSVWLFQRIVDVSTIAAVTRLEFRVFCRAGLVVYMNEQELYRINVPEGPLNVSTVATKVLNPYWHVFTIGSSTLLHQGSNVISIAAVNSDANERTVDFQAIIIPMAHTGVLSRIFADDSLSVGASSSTPSHPASNLIDSDLSTFYESTFSSTSPPEISVLFQNDRVETFNKYCLTATRTTFYQPVAWTLEGKQNNEWESINTVSNALFVSGETKCLSIESGFYSEYRLKLTQSMDSQTLVQLAELGLFYVVSDESSIPVLEMSVTEINAYVDTEFIAEYSVTSEYSNFSVSPSLPAGLFVDPATGLIRGTAQESRLSQMYTLSGSFGETQQFVTFSLRVTECEDSNNSRNILRITVSDYSSGSIRLLLCSETHTLIDDRVEGPSYERRLCLLQDHYRVLFLYQLSNSPSYSITAQNNTYAGVLDSSRSSLEVAVDTRRLIHPQNTVWHYWIRSQTPSSNWFQSSVSSEWPTARAGSFPPTIGITSYFCTSFHASYASYTSAFSVGIFTRGGIILYLNGVEINRVRLPSGEITHSTAPLNHTASPSYVVFSGSVQFLPFVVDESIQVEGGAEGDNNRFCVEEHRPTEMEEATSFIAYMEYVQEDSSRIVDGWSWGSVNGVENPWFEYVGNAFDSNINTKYFGPSDCVDVAVQWNYWNDRKEYVNYLQFYAGNTPGRRPQSLRLEGRVGDRWVVLVEADELEWGSSSGYGQSKEWLFNNSVSYSSYQLVANGCVSEGIEFAEVILKALRINVACGAEGDFPAANEGEESRGPCPEYHSGYATRMCLNGHFSEIDYSRCIPTVPTSFQYVPDRITCYTHTSLYLRPVVTFHVDVFGVSPTLPVGLTFNVTSGEIYGVPVVTTLATYTVTARNIRGTSKATFFLNVQSGCPSISDFPATPVGQEAVYYCGSSFWMLGSVRRRCEDIDGIPTWSLPDGYCQNGALVTLLFIFGAVIVLIFIGVCYMSNSVSRHTKVYELDNGEYELEEFDPNSKEEPTQVVRTRPRMKLIGRPVFIYLPRYFHKSKRDFAAGYHRVDPPAKRKILQHQPKV